MFLLFDKLALVLCLRGCLDRKKVTLLLIMLMMAVDGEELGPSVPNGTRESDSCGGYRTDALSGANVIQSAESTLDAHAETLVLSFIQIQTRARPYVCNYCLICKSWLLGFGGGRLF